MSYDLAVWAGPPPISNEDATGTFSSLAEQLLGGAPAQAADPAIKAYVDALVARWPDETDEDFEEGPWSDAPLMNNASGPLFYFSFVPRRASEVVEFSAALARRHGLVCFDPQTSTLLSDAAGEASVLREDAADLASGRRRWWRRRR